MMISFACPLRQCPQTNPQENSIHADKTAVMKLCSKTGQSGKNTVQKTSFRDEKKANFSRTIRAVV
jgi:hypothetical protein